MLVHLAPVPGPIAHMCLRLPDPMGRAPELVLEHHDSLSLSILSWSCCIHLPMLSDHVEYVESLQNNKTQALNIHRPVQVLFEIAYYHTCRPRRRKKSKV